MEELGVTNNEYKIYRALLHNGASTISNISNAVKIDQRSTYDCIERLINKGLVGQVSINNKRMFLGLNPEIINYIADDKEKKLNEVFDDIEHSSKKQDNKTVINVINSKKDFLKQLKSVSAHSIFLGKKLSEITKTNSYKFFSKQNRLKKLKIDTKASVIVIIGENIFLEYSNVENKGFFVEEKDFIENMKVYFNA